jgi:iron complex outermembrane receptor protein
MSKMPKLKSCRAAVVFGCLAWPVVAIGQEDSPKQLQEVVVSASRTEQRRFDVPAAINAVTVDGFHAMSPLVNLSELLSSVPGLQIRDRQNYAQDLQVSVRGFGTRSTFGVRGVRILIDGIPATMPDGQGQVSSASLTSARSIEVLRGPLAQMYGNAAGGVVQVFTNDPPTSPQGRFVAGSVGAGSYDQKEIDVSAGAGTERLGGLFDLSHYTTDGYRDHSAASRTQFNAKVIGRPTSDTTITGVLNVFNQPLAQDPLGLTHAAFLQNPRQVDPTAIGFDTRKSIEQQQAGVVLEHRLSSEDTISARAYGGTRLVFQTLALNGGTVAGGVTTSAGGVVDLDRSYGGIGMNWAHKTRVAGMPLNWTIGLEADNLLEHRRGFVNNDGTPGALRRNEDDRARDTDVFGQIDWTFAPDWQLLAGIRASRVTFIYDDHYFGDGRNDSGRTEFHNTSPSMGLVWHANDRLNFYANAGTGFETPTLAESAYRAVGTGPNFALQASTSRQVEVGVKALAGRHAIDAALFEARSDNEIVPLVSSGGRTVFQNVDDVRRRGAELSMTSAWGRISTTLAYTWLDARFQQAYVNIATGPVASGNRLPGAPANSLYADVEYRPVDAVTLGAEMRLESKAFVDDINSDAAPGYAVFNLRAGREFKSATAKWYLFGRIDNLFDRMYAGSVIVNDANRRFFEPAAGRRLYVGLRTVF